MLSSFLMLQFSIIYETLIKKIYITFDKNTDVKHLAFINKLYHKN